MARKWGQHFLIRQGVVERMLKLAQICKGAQVVEIGPGKGFLTRALLKRGVQVTAVEIDPGLCQELRVNYGNLEQFHLLTLLMLVLDILLLQFQLVLLDLSYLELVLEQLLLEQQQLQTVRFLP